jgi:hypothetical protein
MAVSVPLHLGTRVTRDMFLGASLRNGASSTGVRFPASVRGTGSVILVSVCFQFFLQPRGVLTSLSFGGVYFWVLSYPTAATTFCTAPPEEMFRSQQKKKRGPRVGSAWINSPKLVAVTKWLGKLSFEPVASSRCAFSGYRCF